MNLWLILCAFGWHGWNYQCAHRDAPRHSARRCGRCDRYEELRPIGAVKDGPGEITYVRWVQP